VNDANQDIDIFDSIVTECIIAKECIQSKEDVNEDPVPCDDSDDTFDFISATDSKIG
jgi:hypothetical protein